MLINGSLSTFMDNRGQTVGRFDPRAAKGNAERFLKFDEDKV